MRPEDNKYFHYYNNNPKGREVDDCVYRALALFQGITWGEIANADMGQYLITGDLVESRDYREECADYGKDYKVGEFIGNFFDCMDICEDVRRRYNSMFNDNKYHAFTVQEFIDNFAESSEIYLVVFRNHVSVIKENKIWDTWDCSRGEPSQIYKKTR